MDTCTLSCDMSGPEWGFRRLMKAHRLAHDAAFERLGLRDVGQPVLLFVLSDARNRGQPCAQKELGALLHLSASTVTASIQSLERNGYVSRRADENDQRRNLVELTSKGVAAAEACRRAFYDIDRAMYAGLGDDERSAVTAVFKHMTDNLLSLAGENDLSKEENECSENSSPS